MSQFYLQQIKPEQYNVLTIHAELEGMKYLDWFKEFLILARKSSVNFCKLESFAQNALTHKANLPVCELIQATVEGRSGKLAVQGSVGKGD
jgi:hypothetical protein